MKGVPAVPGTCAGCGHEGTVFPTYRSRGAGAGESATGRRYTEPIVAPLCSACRVRGAGFHGTVAQARGEPLWPLAAATAGQASSSTQT